MVYTGETGRNLKIRQKEYIDCCSKFKLDKSAVAEHAWDRDYVIKWKESKVIAPVSKYYPRQSVNLSRSINIEQDHRKENLYMIHGHLYFNSSFSFI